MSLINNFINHKNLYSIRFEQFQKCVDLKDQFPEGVKVRIEKILEKSLEQRKNMQENSVATIKSTILLFPEPVRSERNEAFQRLFDEVDEANQNIDQLIKEFLGIDPYEVQDLVHVILGIQPDQTQSLTDEERLQSYKLMSQHGLLTTSLDWFGSFKYDPGVFVAKQLENSPEIETLTIGCGAEVKMYHGSCYFQAKEEHQAPALTLDMIAALGPDVVANMHDPKLWEAIPGNRLIAVQDHTNGPFLFDDQNSSHTLAEIFRTLKPGGLLRLGRGECSTQEHINSLREAGFNIIKECPSADGERVRVLEAQKPL